MFDDEIKEVDAQDMKVRTITPGLKIHTLFVNLHFATMGGFIIVAMESNDNLVDFNRLILENINDDDCFNFKFS